MSSTILPLRQKKARLLLSSEVPEAVRVHSVSYTHLDVYKRQGIHFHTLCEQDSSDLETTLAAVKVKFGDLISQVKWLNLGGGYHITRPGYDIARLEKCIEAAKEEWKVEMCIRDRELTSEQVKDVYTGNITTWEDLTK